MSIGLRWFLQLLLAGLLAVLIYVFGQLIREGGKPGEFLLLTSGMVVFTGLIWLAKFIGNPAIRAEEWKAWFYSPANPLMRHFKLIMAGLAIVNVIANIFAGHGSATP